jgi:hypothetical protein
MENREASGGWGWILPIGIAALLVFFFVWAALHDIARQESGATVFLAVGIPLFAFFCRRLLRLRPQRHTPRRHA